MEEKKKLVPSKKRKPSPERAKSAAPTKHLKSIAQREERKTISEGSSARLPYIAAFNGPILFTAPHSSRVFRGGKAWGEEIRLHQRESYTALLAIKCAQGIGAYMKEGGGGSFCVWERNTPLRASNLDPNYLKSESLANSDFHCALHHFARKFKRKPLLHIDIHGKVNRKGNRNIDMGIKPMVKRWDDQTLVKSMKASMKSKLDAVFSEVKVDGMRPECINELEKLTGFWLKPDLFTLSHQSVEILNIPAF